MLSSLLTDGDEVHVPVTLCLDVGIIDAQKALAALARSGATDIALILEIIPAFEQDDDQALADIRQSAEYWRDALTRRLSG
jgi:hypothetical protein